MGKLIKEKTDKGRLHIDTPLMGESLVSKALLKKTEATEYFRMHPDINVIKIGGQSIMDRGAKALLPILEALIEAKDKHCLSRSVLQLIRCLKSCPLTDDYPLSRFFILLRTLSHAV